MTDQIPESELSPAASARRASMKYELTETFTTHHRRRQSRRSALRACAAVIAVALLVQILLPTIATNSTPETPVEIPGGTRVTGVIRVVMIGNDPGILERLAPPRRHRVTRVNDDDLLATLASYGHDTGLIRRGDEVVLTRELLQ